MRVNPSHRHAPLLSPSKNHLQLDVPHFTSTHFHFSFTASVKLF